MATAAATHRVVTETFSTDVRSFLTSVPRYAAIATINRDGSPHQTVIWYDVRGDEIAINSKIGRRWPANLRRDPRATLTIYERADGVTLECEVVRTVEGEEALADISNMAWRYCDPEEAAELIEEWRRQERITFILRLTRIHIAGEPR